MLLRLHVLRQDGHALEGGVAAQASENAPDATVIRFAVDRAQTPSRRGLEQGVEVGDGAQLPPRNANDLSERSN